jgi:hypothetical protein
VNKVVSADAVRPRRTKNNTIRRGSPEIKNVKMLEAGYVYDGICLTKNVGVT